MFIPGTCPIHPLSRAATADFHHQIPLVEKLAPLITASASAIAATTTAATAIAAAVVGAPAAGPIGPAPAGRAVASTGAGTSAAE